MKRLAPIADLLLLLSLAAAAWEAGRPPPGSSAGLAAHVPVSLSDHLRLLVLAPHSDDEVLGAAGLIRAALRAGLEVRVVIATNGDGHLFATMQDLRRVYPRPGDFIRMGELRQQESLTALAELGLATENVIFLSYPDRGTALLWNNFWSEAHPYRSPFSGATRSPYPVTYNPDSVYAGEDYLADLVSILESYQPDLIVYPHPDDVHPDHWGLAAFTRLAMATVERAHPDYRPWSYAYLIHRPRYPVTSGAHDKQALEPPAALLGIDPNWFRIDLDGDDELIKAKALAAYQSQVPLSRKLFAGLTRATEIFAQPQPAELPTLAAGDAGYPASWRDGAGEPIRPVQLVPVMDFIARRVIAGADLMALYAAQTADQHLVVCVQSRGRTPSQLDYTLRVKAIGERVVSHTASSWKWRKEDQTATRSGAFACDTVGMSDLGDPWLLVVGASVEEVGAGILDQTAWQVVYVAGLP